MEDIIQNKFYFFCKSHGIKQMFTTRYTPQQNCIAKLNNKTIMDMTRSMLKAMNMSNEYWGEEVGCSVCILNRCPTKVSKDRIPLEAWRGGEGILLWLKNLWMCGIFTCRS